MQQLGFYTSLFHIGTTMMCTHMCTHTHTHYTYVHVGTMHTCKTITTVKGHFNALLNQEIWHVTVPVFTRKATKHTIMTNLTTCRGD